jgi:hypothetical protein
MDKPSKGTTAIYAMMKGEIAIASEAGSRPNPKETKSELKWKLTSEC